MMKKILFTLIVLLATSASFAQDFGKIIRADEKYAALAFNEALELYLDVYDKKLGNVDYVAAKIANCYRLTGQPTESLKWFNRVSATTNMEPINYLYYAQALAASEKYEVAVVNYKKFLDNYPNDSRGILGIEACDRANDMAKMASIATVSRTNVNSEYSDFAPAFSSDGLVFASNRKNPLTFDYTDKWTGANYLDLYVSRNDGQGGLTSPSLMAANVNTVYHESNAAYSPDGKTMVFTRSQFNTGAFGGHIVKSTIDNVVKLKLVVFSRNSDGKWSQGVEFPYNDPTVSYAHPTFSNDGKTLFFTSDRSGGFGGTDIWKCFINADGTFGTPENLGETINTAGQEMFPFVDKNNTLYYSSNGLNTLGGLDVFVCYQNLETNTYGSPSNIGKPVNGPADDFAVAYNAESNRGYFSSNREGGMGSDDIYGFSLNGIFLEFEILDDATHMPINKASVWLDKTLYGKSNVKGMATIGVEVNKNYHFSFSAAGYLSKETDISTIGQAIGSVYRQTIYLKCATGSFIKGVVYEDKSKLPVKNATVTILNKVTNKETILVTDVTGTYKFDLCPGIKYMVKAEKKGYDADSVEFSTMDMEPNTAIVQDLTLKNGEEVTALEFYEIYFDFDKWFLRKNASADLEKMYTILTNSKDLKVEVGAHTDSRGRDEYNIRLSNKRADAVVKYLIGRGINPSRIIPNGYGESQLKNDCKDGVPCTDEQHQANRRVEFKLLDRSNTVVGKSKERE